MKEASFKTRHHRMTQTQPESSPLQRWLPETWLRRLWPLYCLLVLLVTSGYALWDNYQIVRYVLNHPEIPALFAVLLLLGARPDLCRRLSGNGFWVAPMLLGIGVWCIYGIVNIEERYLTVGFLVVVLPSSPPCGPRVRTPPRCSAPPRLPSLCSSPSSPSESPRASSSIFAVISPQATPEDRTTPRPSRRPPHSTNSESAGDAIACVGTRACVYDHYWARIAGIRILTEIYQPEPHPYASLATLAHLDKAIDTVRGQGAKVVVGYFNPGAMTGTGPDTAAGGARRNSLLRSPSQPCSRGR
jgi:hypothetical protein